MISPPRITMTPANDNGLGDDGIVYVVGFDYYVKIGFTRRLQQRLRAIEHGLPKVLVTHATFAGDMNCEYALQNHFRHVAAERGEWFTLTGSLGQWIDQGCDSSVYQRAISVFPGTDLYRSAA